MIQIQPLWLLLPVMLLGGLLLLERRAGSGIAGRGVIAVARSAIQLGLLGFVLVWLFRSAGVIWLALCVVVMLAAALREILAHQEDKRDTWPVLLSSALGLSLSAAFSMGIALLILGIGPGGNARIFIPLLGMVLGNAMNGLSLVLQGVLQRLRAERESITELLALGLKPAEALATIRREELRRGMIPVINSMATVGIVFLPGMMTGQLLAGAEVMQSIYYQYLILVLIFMTTLLSLRIALKFLERSLFDERQRLRD